MDRLVAWCSQNRAAVLLATLLVVAWGLVSFRGLTIEAFPDPSDTQVQIITRRPGQPAEEIERQVSIPIERAVNGVPGLARVRSINLFGLSYMTLTFRDDVDAQAARTLTLERLRLVNLPDGVRPELGSLSTPIGEIYRYTLTSPDREPMRLRATQDWVVRPRLLQIEGVADVITYGGLVREIQVRPDPVAMAARGLTLESLQKALEDASENASGGVMERGAEQLVIRSEGLFTDIADIGRVAVGTFGGTPTLLSEVASVQVGWAPRQGVVGRGGDEDAVEGVILMRRGANPSIVLERVRARVAELNAGVLENDTKIAVFYDRTELVTVTLATVGRNLVEGAVLVVLVLFVFLLDLRAALLVAVLIPLSLLTAFIYLHLRGMSANLLSLGAVDFGVIVDGAVVMVEAIARRMSEDPPATPTDLAANIRRALGEVVRPTLLAVLIIIAAYLPIFLLERVEGRIFAPLAHTVVAALAGSLVFSLTLVPVLATFAFRRVRPHRESPVLRVAARLYAPALRAALRRPVPVLVVAVAALALSARVLAVRGSEFLPELNEGSMYLTVTLPPNTSLAEGRRLVPILGHLIDGFPQVESRISQLGRPEDGTDPKLTNNLEFFVKLKPASAWPADTPTLGAVMDRMSDAFVAIPGVDVNFSQPIRDNVNESIAGQQGQVALKIYASDLDQLQRVAEKARAILVAVPGATDVALVKSGSVPQLLVKPRREALGRFGITMDEVQQFLATALGGHVTGELWEGERVCDIVLRFPGSARDTVEQLAALRIPTRGGALVPLGSVADIRLGQGRAAINRENGQRYVGVRMNVRGRDLGSFVEEAQSKVAAAVTFAPGTVVEWGGEFESKERAMRRLELVIPIVLVITLVLLFYAFRSVGLALLVLGNVPFALVGGALGLWVCDMPVSISAAVGFIALVGQASLNGVLVVSAIEQRRRAGVPVEEAIWRGTQERLRAVLMTAALAALGLVPAATSRAMGAEMQRPMAVVIVGGTLSAALLTLLVLPVTYRLFVRALAPPTDRAAIAEGTEGAEGAEGEGSGSASG